MALYDDIIAVYPELAIRPEVFKDGAIMLQNDGDGDYIRKWDYVQPMPEGLPARLTNDEENK